MPKLTKLFCMLTVISTLLILSSAFAQVLDSRNGEDAVEPEVSPTPHKKR